jgi:acetyl-CoA acyltransferase
MASDAVWIVGADMSAFGRHKLADTIDLASQAAIGALNDSGLTIHDMQVLGAGTMFGPIGTGQLLQHQIGQTGIPVYNVQNACATGASALRTVYLSILAGEAELGLAVGVEQMGKVGLLPTITAAGGSGETYERTGRNGAIVDTEGVLGTGTMPGVFAQAGMDYLREHSNASVEHFYKIAEKNHAHSTLNPLSHYRRRFTLDEIRSSAPISYPNTVLMCSPNTDGAAAIVLASGTRLRTMPRETQRRAVKISASILTTDSWTPSGDSMPDVNTCTRAAAAQAYAAAGIGPSDLDLVELHDCFATAELLHYDNLGLCERGGAGDFLDSGAPYRNGRTPVNVSGGLESKGHPIGATGIANLFEVATQLRAEAGDRQIEGARVGMTHVVGLGSTCAVHILERATR